MPTLAQIRALPTAVDVAYILFVDGVQYAWATAHTDDALLGGGTGTWIDDLGDGRTILDGLVLSANMPLERLDPTTGLLEGMQLSFTLVDFGGEVATTFVGEAAPSEWDMLCQDIQPGTSNLGTSVIIQGGDTVNPRGRWIGLEAIGPLGQRNYWSCFPDSVVRVGPHHACNVFGNFDDGPPLARVSTRPLDHAGRMAALYRIYRNPEDGTWPSWDSQHAAGGLVWVGRLMDAGSLTSDRKWTIRCAGFESLLRKTLNVNTHSEFMTMQASVALNDDERSIAIEMYSLDPPAAVDIRDSASIAVVSQFAASLTKSAAISHLNTQINAVLSGATTDYGGPTALDTIRNANVFVSDDGAVNISIDLDNADPYMAGMRLMMHEKVWRLLGWEPILQAVTHIFDCQEEHQARFKRYDSGDQYTPEFVSQTPGDSYWRGSFTTLPLDFNQDPTAASLHIDNDGVIRTYRPLYNGEIQLLSGERGQIISLTAGDFPFVEFDPAQPFPDDATTANVEGSRLWIFKGKRVKGIPQAGQQVLQADGSIVDIGQVEAEDYVGIARLSWVESSYGEVSQDNGSHQFIVDEWLDPRHFGYNVSKMGGEWVGLLGEGDFEIRCAPLATYAYNTERNPAQYRLPNPLEASADVFCQLLLSTGTATGWSDDYDNAPTFTRGSNMTAGDSFWSGDIAKADMGLGIPQALVADVDDIASAFDGVAGGVLGGLNRVRHFYLGPYQADDVIASLLRSRGLSLSLHGMRLGVTRLGNFAPGDYDFDLTEDDLDDQYGDAVSQEIRAMGQIDEVRMAYGWNALEANTDREWVVRARDAGAKQRFGDLKLELEDRGLVQYRSGADLLTWTELFWETWAKERPEFYASRHFKIVNLRVNRIQGQDIHVGARVRVTNPWVLSGRSEYGVTHVRGTVVGVTLEPSKHVYVLEVLCYADQESLRLFGPIATVSGVSGSTVTLSATPNFATAEDFNTKAYDSGGHGRVYLVTWDSANWATYGPYTISSVDTGLQTVTLTSSPGQPIRDRDTYLIMADYDNQGGTTWATNLLSVIVLSNFTFGSGPTKGWPLVG